MIRSYAPIPSFALTFKPTLSIRYAALSTTPDNTAICRHDSPVCIKATQYFAVIRIPSHINSTRICGSQNICIAPFDKMLDHLYRATKASPTHTYTHKHTHSHTLHAHIYTHTLHTHIHIYTHTLTHTLHIYTHITYTHIYIHTHYIYTHTVTHHKHRTKKKIYHSYCRYHSKQVELSLCATISTLILYRFSR